MVNSRRLRGLLCPSCSARQPFRIAGRATFTMYDECPDGYDAVEWDMESACSCVGCGHEATVREFTEAGRHVHDRPGAVGDALSRLGPPSHRRSRDRSDASLGPSTIRAAIDGLATPRVRQTMTFLDSIITNDSL